MEFHILLVEDDRVTLKAVEQLLRKCNYKVTCAANGREAIKVLSSCKQHGERVDLILTDILMPEVTGFDLINEVVHGDSFCDVPVVVMSSQDSQESVLQAFQAGAADYLIKPIRHNELATLWQHVWRANKARSSPRSGAGQSIRDGDEEGLMQAKPDGAPDDRVKNSSGGSSSAAFSVLQSTGGTLLPSNAASARHPPSSQPQPATPPPTSSHGTGLMEDASDAQQPPGGRGHCHRPDEAPASGLYDNVALHAGDGTHGDSWLSFPHHHNTQKHQHQHHSAARHADTKAHQHGHHHPSSSSGAGCHTFAYNTSVAVHFDLNPVPYSASGYKKARGGSGDPRHATSQPPADTSATVISWSHPHPEDTTTTTQLAQETAPEDDLPYKRQRRENTDSRVTGADGDADRMRKTTSPNAAHMDERYGSGGSVLLRVSSGSGQEVGRGRPLAAAEGSQGSRAPSASAEPSSDDHERTRTPSGGADTFAESPSAICTSGQATTTTTTATTATESGSDADELQQQHQQQPYEQQSEMVLPGKYSGGGQFGPASGGDYPAGGGGGIAPCGPTTAPSAPTPGGADGGREVATAAAVAVVGIQGISLVDSSAALGGGDVEGQVAAEPHMVSHHSLPHPAAAAPPAAAPGCAVTLPPGLQELAALGAARHEQLWTQRVLMHQQQQHRQQQQHQRKKVEAGQGAGGGMSGQRGQLGAWMGGDSHAAGSRTGTTTSEATAAAVVVRQPPTEEAAAAVPGAGAHATHRQGAPQAQASGIGNSGAVLADPTPAQGECGAGGGGSGPSVSRDASAAGGGAEPLRRPGSGLSLLHHSDRSAFTAFTVFLPSRVAAAAAAAVSAAAAALPSTAMATAAAGSIGVAAPAPARPAPPLPAPPSTALHPQVPYPQSCPPTLGVHAPAVPQSARVPHLAPVMPLQTAPVGIPQKPHAVAAKSVVEGPVAAAMAAAAHMPYTAAFTPRPQGAPLGFPPAGCPPPPPPVFIPEPVLHLIAALSGRAAAEIFIPGTVAATPVVVAKPPSAARLAAVAKYLEKRKHRNFQKKVRYESRKRLAEARPRVRGQFVKAGTAPPLATGHHVSGAAGGPSAAAGVAQMRRGVAGGYGGDGGGYVEAGIEMDGEGCEHAGDVDGSDESAAE